MPCAGLPGLGPFPVLPAETLWRLAPQSSCCCHFRAASVLPSPDLPAHTLEPVGECPGVQKGCARPPQLCTVGQNPWGPSVWGAPQAAPPFCATLVCDGNIMWVETVTCSLLRRMRSGPEASKIHLVLNSLSAVPSGEAFPSSLLSVPPSQSPCHYPHPFLLLVPRV